MCGVPGEAGGAAPSWRWRANSPPRVFGKRRRAGRRARAAPVPSLTRRGAWP
ncbi:hypothetical protein Ga0080559_TMP3376 [Salipiger profundus]|uniref:Uncharacterized protein n=1 Tax=Salipiger profundus TaxID=1229727 RepID=A0A1U7D7T6_9RHOB|nr:hypothetical protein Ga0080559_TMP3376 [Salipiger profundus]